MVVLISQHGTNLCTIQYIGHDNSGHMTTMLECIPGAHNDIELRTLRREEEGKSSLVQYIYPYHSVSPLVLEVKGHQPSQRTVDAISTEQSMGVAPKPVVIHPLQFLLPI